MEWFSTIQHASSDNDTINNDTIVIGEGTYIENIVFNKKHTIMSVCGSVTVQTLE
ncbi:MAG: hypothetical protein ABFC34_05565 [Methanobacterium sp.]